MTKRILITGGAGFIGSHIVDALVAQGDDCIVVDDESTGRPEYVNPAVKAYVKGDVTDRATLRHVFEAGVDAVFHIAGQASIQLSFNNPAQVLRTNTVGTINVLDMCVEYRVPRLLFASSMTLYGVPTALPTPETAPVHPVSYYAVTKYAAERYAHITARRKDLDFDFNVTSLRMFNVYGPRQSLTNPYQGVLAIFLGNVLRGEPLAIHSDGNQSRDFVYVADVVRAWLMAIDEPSAFGAVINIGSGREVSVNELCDRVLASFGHTRETYEVVHQAAQPGDIRRSVSDIGKAKKLLGWSPEVSLEEGIRHTVNWARQHAGCNQETG